MKRFFIPLIVLLSFLLSSADLSKKNIDSMLDQLDEIGDTSDPDLLDKKAILANDVALYYQFADNYESARLYFLKWTKKMES